MVYSIPNISNQQNGYQNLIDFYHYAKEHDKLKINLNNWFAANISAALGALLDQLKIANTQCFLGDIDYRVSQILAKNGFLSSHFGYQKVEDTHNTTIPYFKLASQDGKAFNEYISYYLLERDEMPKMSQGVIDKMMELIHELFANAQMHSATQHVYTCGQFFPQKNKIEFTIVDTGIGFKENINRKFKRNLSARQAITWAIQDKNTTKENTGGLGLTMLKEFTDSNNGKIQIVSNDGYYQFENGYESTSSLRNEFPGTIINIQFNTNDNNSYILKQELDINNIF